VNIGNPTEFTIAGLVATLEQVLGHPLPVTYAPLPQDDPKVRQPDITRAQTRLGWAPTVPLAEGLRATLAYFRSRTRP
jgi:nucleoside-diphosphate-sugar epimerase